MQRDWLEAHMILRPGRAKRHTWRALSGASALACQPAREYSRFPGARTRLRMAARERNPALSRILYLVGATVGGAIGWWIGERVGVMTAFFLGLVGTAAGIYVGRRIGRRYFF
jgi:apolipoprotein N-acyltransferase